MPIKAPRIRINAPVGVVPYGRGFYQLEEEELYLAVEYPNERPRFFSYLESDSLSFHFDRRGRLIFIELLLPRRRWKEKNDLIVPQKAERADVRFLDFRSSFSRPAIYCDKRRQTLMFRFDRGPAVKNLYLAENLIAGVTDSNRMAMLWVSDIVDDLAGREIYAWRKKVHGEPIVWPPHLAKTARM